MTTNNFNYLIKRRFDFYSVIIPDQQSLSASFPPLDKRGTKGDFHHPKYNHRKDFLKYISDIYN